jgi:hypothetical protein
MSVIGSNILAGASGQGGDYTIARSLRFRSSASAYLNRTPASAGNRKTWTWSGWVKRGRLGVAQGFLSAGTNGNQIFFAGFSATDDKIYIHNGVQGSSTASWGVTSAVYRDPSAWYHVVLVMDTTQATATDRVKLYVNNQLQTLSGFFGSNYYPSQNYDTAWNNNVIQEIGYGYENASKSYFDGYVTEIHFIDGQALTPSSFGANSPTTGVWQPKKYAGTYGTNGFYLPFTNNSTTTTLGNDFSGNGNNWTTNNISLTAGSTYDSMTDVPTLTDITTANYCVLNPLNSPAVTLSNANLTVLTNTSGTNYSFATMAMPTSGKWYWEYVGTSNGSECYCGISNESRSKSVIYYAGTGLKYVDNVGSSYGATYGDNDVIGVAVDIGANTVTFYKNNTSQGAISYTFGSEIFFPYFADGSSSVGVFINANFGQRPFAYTPPTGFVALNTFNLPTPTIGATASTQANKNFDIATYNNATVVSGLGFAPDFVWHKSRNQAYSHYLYDKVRGTGAKGLNSNTTSAEGANDALGIVSFDSSGVTYSSDAGLSQTNAVGWFWKGGGTGVSNTAGSITSTVSANTSAGFSVVTYTGNGTGGATVGHGLGVAPSMVIVKERSNVNGWFVYHQSLGNTRCVYLDSTSAQATVSIWNNTTPTSSVITYNNGVEVNRSSGTYVAYCFSEIAGYSRFGSYTGNGSTDGTFVHTGFRPKFVMIKRSDSGNNWFILDTSRDTFNLANDQLLPNSSAAESTGSDCNIDILSNGFKLRTALDASNGSGGTYIYACFAENPYKYSLAR